MRFSMWSSENPFLTNLPHPNPLFILWMVEFIGLKYLFLIFPIFTQGSNLDCISWGSCYRFWVSDWKKTLDPFPLPEDSDLCLPIDLTSLPNKSRLIFPLDLHTTISFICVMWLLCVTELAHSFIHIGSGIETLWSDALATKLRLDLLPTCRPSPIEITTYPLAIVRSTYDGVTYFLFPSDLAVKIRETHFRPQNRDFA